MEKQTRSFKCFLTYPKKQAGHINQEDQIIKFKYKREKRNLYDKVDSGTGLVLRAEQWCVPCVLGFYGLMGHSGVVCVLFVV